VLHALSKVARQKGIQHVASARIAAIAARCSA
jgi:hypothetical protein